MNAGVPWTAFSPVLQQVRLGALAQPLDDSEIQHLHEVELLAVAAEEDVRGLDVAVHQAAGFRLGQGMAHLAQQEDGPLGRCGPEAAEKLVGVEAVEQLHDVVEGAVGGDAEVEQLHRVGRAEPGDHLRLALEAAKRLARDAAPALVARERRPDELDGRGPGQHPMPGAPDLPHPTLPELLLQLIAPQLARALDLGAQLRRRRGSPRRPWPPRAGRGTRTRRRTAPGRAGRLGVRTPSRDRRARAPS